MLTRQQKIEIMKTALKFSPLGASVFAWRKNDKGLYVNPDNEPDNHWVAVVGYVENEYWIIFDSYKTGYEQEFIKHLSFDFPFGQVKRYHLEKNLTQEKTNFLINAYQWIITALQYIIDYKKEEQNALNSLPKLENTINATTTPKTPISPSLAPKTTLVVPFAEAIKEMEGWFIGSRSYKNLNPGNLKYTSYTKSLGATGKDRGGFCIFPDYTKGFSALCQFITDAADDKLKLCKKCTIYSFCAGYAPASDKNQPKKYAEFIAKQLHVLPDVLLKDII